MQRSRTYSTPYLSHHEYDGKQYLNYTVVQLKAKCKEYGLKDYSTMRKKELLFLLFTAQ